MGAAHLEYPVAKPEKRSRSNQPACSLPSTEGGNVRAEPVALDAMRMARPVRRRLTGVMSKSVEECQLLFRLEAIPVFYPIATFLALLERGATETDLRAGELEIQGWHLGD